MEKQMKLNQWRAFALVSMVLLSAVAVGQQRNSADIDVQFKAASQKEIRDGDLKGAIAAYQKILNNARANRDEKAKALLEIGRLYEKLGSADAQKAYDRVVKEFSSQLEAVAEARERLEVLGVARSPGIPTAQLVTTGDDADSGAFISPDGRFLSRPHWLTGDLAVRDMSTGKTARLFAKAGAWESDEEIDTALISPNGKRIAFLFRTEEGKHQLRVMPNEPGAHASVLVDSREDTAWPVAWSPDSRSILVTVESHDQTWRLAWIPASGGDIKPLQSLGWRLRTSPSLSPDGRYIAYSALATNPSKALSGYVSPAPPDSADQYIYLIAADGSRLTELVKGNSTNESPVWTPDGRHILFVSNRSGQFTLWSVAVTDGKPETGSLSPVMADAGRISPIGMTQAGSYYYVKDSTPRSASGERIYPFDLFTAKLDASGKIQGRATRILDSFVDSNKDPALSPDGKSLAFLRRRPGNDSNVFDQIVVRSVAGGEEHVYNRNAPAAPVMWFHDGASLLILPGGRRRLFRLDLKTGEFTALENLAQSTPPFQIRSLAISANDDIVYMALQNPMDRIGSIVSLNLKTGEQKQIWTLKSTGYIDDIALSPDGRTLAMISGSHLLQIGVDGTGYRDLQPFAYEGMLAWSPSGEYLFFLGANQDGAGQLMRWNAKTGKSDPTGLPITQVRHPLAVGPDGVTLIFSDITDSTELWRIDNLSTALRGNAR